MVAGACSISARHRSFEASLARSGNDRTDGTRKRSSGRAAPTPSWCTKARRQSAGVNTGRRKNSLGSTRGEATAKRPRHPSTRGSGGSRASSWTESTEGEALPSSRYERHSSQSGNREAASSKRIPWFRRGWPPCPSGVGLGLRACSARKDFASSRHWGPADCSCAKQFPPNGRRNLNSGPRIQRLRGPVDQLEDRYLGMVEAVGSNPTRSIPITVQNYYLLRHRCGLHATKRRRQVASTP